MKKLMIIAVLASMTVAASAQEKEKKSPEERARIRTEQMAKDLSLTPEQQAKVEAINLKYAAQAHEARPDHAEQREAGKAMKDARDAELKAVLTEEQYTKWMAKKDAKDKRKESHEQMRKERKDN